MLSVWEDAICFRFLFFFFFFSFSDNDLRPRKDACRDRWTEADGWMDGSNTRDREECARSREKRNLKKKKEKKRGNGESAVLCFFFFLSPPFFGEESPSSVVHHFETEAKPTHLPYLPPIDEQLEEQQPQTGR